LVGGLFVELDMRDGVGNSKEEKMIGRVRVA